MSRRTLGALIALVIACVPAKAHAGTYTVQLCAASNAAFALQNDDAALFSTTAACPWQERVPYTGVYVGVRPGSASLPRGASAGWTVSAPAGTSFDALEVRRRLRKIDPDYEIAVIKADGSVVDGCAAVELCGEEVATRTYRLTSSVRFRLRCAASSCDNSPQGPRAWLSLESVTATVNDPAPPVVTAPAAPAWQRSASVTVSATDASGVSALAVQAGDQTLGTAALPCDFRNLQPCPGTGTASIDVPLPDGRHQLTTRATDATGQTATSAPWTLLLDRVAPASPIGLTVRANADGRFTYSWTNPDQGDAAPIAAAHLSDGTTVRGANLQTLESASPVERIHLEDEAGNADPATAATVSAGSPVRLDPPVLRPATPRIRITSAKRSGTRLIVKGTVANASVKRVTATVKRGRRTASRSATLSRGRFTVRVSLTAPLRTRGTLHLTVKHGSVKATKRVRLR